MSSAFHRDCDIKYTFPVRFANEQCETLVSGFSRAECTRYKVPSQVSKIITAFVCDEHLEFTHEANEETLAHCFGPQLNAVYLSKGNWYIFGEYDSSIVPSRVLSVQHMMSGGKGCTRKSRLALESPFASNDAFKRDLFVRHSPHCRIWPVKTVRHLYLVSHIDDDELVCLDEDYEEMYWRLSDRKWMANAGNQKLLQRVRVAVQEAEARGDDLYAVVLESYCREPYCILRTVVDVSPGDGRQNTEDNLESNKSQRQKPALIH